MTRLSEKWLEATGNTGMDIVQEWKSFWLNQRQNSQEDYENYSRRAMGIDANMKHHLADLIDARTLPLREAVAKVLDAASEALPSVVFSEQADELEMAIAELQKMLEERK